MTLILHLPPDVEARLHAVAQEQGRDPAEVAETLLDAALPAMTSRPPANGTTCSDRDPTLVAVVKRIRGKFAYTATSMETEALHRERQADKVREERRFKDTPP
jgi:hypothetical protein